MPLSPTPSPTLVIGSRIGPYEIVSFLAAGGMGEVYIASDARLEREVAIKVLPASYGSDPDRLRRFEQEARAAGRLNHPNIVAVYDVARDGELPYIVTELLEGRTLRQILRDERLSVEKTIHYAMQIARGLAAAHDKGIVHRDLKPANVFITRDDQVKIVDFGLAKLTHPEWDGSQNNEETLSLLSEPGSVVGTAGYMSPEQVRGLPVDHRSDIFSFGTLLYEMLTSHRAFAGASAFETMKAIADTDPPPEPLQHFPAPLRGIVRRCLERSVAARFQSARDLLFTLESYEGPVSGRSRSTITDRVSAIVSTVKRRPRTASLIGAAIALTVLATFITRSSETQASIERAPVEAAVPKIVSTRLTSEGEVATAAISPNGAFIAYTVKRGDGYVLKLEHVPSASDRELFVPPTPLRLSVLSFSPDGNSIFFRKESGSESSPIYKIPLLGGVEQFVTTGSDLDFQPQGVSFVATRYNEESQESSVVVVSEDGSDERILAKLSSGLQFSAPSWSPDGRTIVVAEHDWNAGTDRILEIDATTGATSVFCPVSNPKMFIYMKWLRDGTGIIAAPSAMAGGQLWLLTRGNPPRRISSDQVQYTSISTSISTGKLVVTAQQPSFHLWRIPLQNPETPEPLTTGLNATDGQRGVAVMPDSRVIFTSRGENGIDLWIRSRDGSSKARLTSDDGDEVQPTLSEDGRTLVFLSSQTGIWQLDTVTGQKKRILAENGGAPSISPDGRSVYYTPGGEAAARKISLDTLQSSEIQLKVPCGFARLSPDGRMLACSAFGKGGYHIIDLESGKPIQQFSILPNSGSLRWTPDSQGIIYAAPTGKATNVFLQPIAGGSPRQLTRFTADSVQHFAWTPEGDLVCSQGGIYSDAFLLQLTRGKE